MSTIKCWSGNDSLPSQTILNELSEADIYVNWSLQNLAIRSHIVAPHTCFSLNF